MRTQARGNSGVNKSKGISGVSKLPDWEAMFAELIQHQESHEDALSMEEWEELTGRSSKSLRKYFRAAEKVDRLEVGSVMKRGLDKRMYRIPVYRVLPEKKV